MSHFTISAIFPFQTQEKEKIKKDLAINKKLLIDLLAAKLKKPLGYYDTEYKIKPYKDHVKEKELQEIARHYQVNPQNLQLLEKKLLDWRGEAGASTGIDQNGLFIFSRVNKKGKFDYWNAYDVFLVDELLLDNDFVSQAIFTPECKYIESKTWFYVIGESNKDDYQEWTKKFKNTLGLYSPDALVLLIDCHI